MGGFVRRRGVFFNAFGKAAEDFSCENPQAAGAVRGGGNPLRQIFEEFAETFLWKKEVILWFLQKKIVKICCIITKNLVQ